MAKPKKQKIKRVKIEKAQLISRKIQRVEANVIELVTLEERNDFSIPASKEGVIYFRRYSINDFIIGKHDPEKIIVGWKNIYQDDVELIFKQEYTDYIPPEWAKSIDDAAMACYRAPAKKKTATLLYTEMGLAKIRALQGKINKPAEKVTVHDLLIEYVQESIIGWENVYQNDKLVKFDKKLIVDLPFGALFYFMPKFARIIKAGNIQLKN